MIAKLTDATLEKMLKVIVTGNLSWECKTCTYKNTDPQFVNNCKMCLLKRTTSSTSRPFSIAMQAVSTSSPMKSGFSITDDDNETVLSPRSITSATASSLLWCNTMGSNLIGLSADIGGAGAAAVAMHASGRSQQRASQASGGGMKRRAIGNVVRSTVHESTYVKGQRIAKLKRNGGVNCDALVTDAALSSDPAVAAQAGGGNEDNLVLPFLPNEHVTITTSTATAIGRVTRVGTTINYCEDDEYNSAATTSSDSKGGEGDFDDPDCSNSGKLSSGEYDVVPDAKVCCLHFLQLPWQ